MKTRGFDVRMDGGIYAETAPLAVSAGSQRSGGRNGGLW